MSMGVKAVFGRTRARAYAVLAYLVIGAMALSFCAVPAYAEEDAPTVQEPVVEQNTEEAPAESGALSLDINGAKITIEIEDEDTPLAQKKVASGLHYLIIAGIAVTSIYTISVCVRRKRFASDLADYEGDVLRDSPYNKKA